MTSAALVSTTVYLYDGIGSKVAKINCPTGSGSGTCIAATPGGSTVWYIYDVAGNLAAEYGQSSSATAPPCTTCYLIGDHLGSTRVMMDQNGSPVSAGCHDYLPFGEELSAGVDGRSGCYPDTTLESGLLFAG